MGGTANDNVAYLFALAYLFDDTQQGSPGACRRIRDKSGDDLRAARLIKEQVVSEKARHVRG